jgi:ABC-type spermidine/putrescine transport system permease subunit II
MAYAFLGSNTLDVMGPTSMIMPAVITVIAIFLIWFSVAAKNKQWLT